MWRLCSNVPLYKFSIPFFSVSSQQVCQKSRLYCLVPCSPSPHSQFLMVTCQKNKWQLKGCVQIHGMLWVKRASAGEKHLSDAVGEIWRTLQVLTALEVAETPASVDIRLMFVEWSSSFTGGCFPVKSPIFSFLESCPTFFCNCFFKSNRNNLFAAEAGVFFHFFAGLYHRPFMPPTDTDSTPHGVLFEGSWL